MKKQYIVKLALGGYATLWAQSYEDALQQARKMLGVRSYPFNASRLTQADRGVTGEMFHFDEEERSSNEDL